MYLLEHDAKTLLALYGGAASGGFLVDCDAIDVAQLPPSPWMVKAQIAAGGRGKAGLIRSAATVGELRAQVRALLGATHGGAMVRSCRIESQVTGFDEAYLSFMLDPVAAGVRVMAAAHGGVDIEQTAASAGAIRSATAAPQQQEIIARAQQLTAGLEAHIARALNSAAAELGRIFLEAELTLLEINPLFARADGGWVAGDAKIVTDDNALFRQPQQRALLASRAHAYREAQRKQQHGCDYVVVDEDGDIGLLTTGAGLSMMLIDELRAAGLKPYNFLDVRTGGLRGDPARLITVLNWIAEGKRVRVLLVNIFAGITDLGEFARLLVAALAQAQVKVPVVARLVGAGLEAARPYLASRDIPVVTELGAALEHVRRHLAS